MSGIDVTTQPSNWRIDSIHPNCAVRGWECNNISPRSRTRG